MGNCTLQLRQLLMPQLSKSSMRRTCMSCPRVALVHMSRWWSSRSLNHAAPCARLHHGTRIERTCVTMRKSHYCKYSRVNFQLSLIASYQPLQASLPTVLFNSSSQARWFCKILNRHRSFNRAKQVGYHRGRPNITMRWFSCWTSQIIKIMLDIRSRLKRVITTKTRRYFKSVSRLPTWRILEGTKRWKHREVSSLIDFETPASTMSWHHRSPLGLPLLGSSKDFSRRTKHRRRIELQLLIVVVPLNAHRRQSKVQRFNL